MKWWTTWWQFCGFGVLVVVVVVQAHCPNLCSGHGQCDKYSRCHCDRDYRGGDCSEHLCPFGLAWSDNATAIDYAHQLSECSNRGLCNRATGHCECMDGFTGSSCERLACPQDCHGRGRCFSMRDYAIKARNDLSEAYSYTKIWDSLKIQGCVCDYPGTGYDCSQSLCPKGDDPLTKNQVNEVQLMRCRAATGSFFLYYKGLASGIIQHHATALDVRKALLVIPTLTNIKVTFSQPHAPVCQLQDNVVSIEFNEQFGPQPPLVAVPDRTLTQNGGSIDISADGITPWKDVAKKEFKSIKGTKENDFCSNRGICDPADGVCSCFETNNDVYGSSNGYGLSGSRGDCGFVVSATTKNVSTCPGDIPCSGHGVCETSSFRCHCSTGWMGGDCSQMQCPYGRSWFSLPQEDDVAHFDRAECANMGHCDRSTGKCQCRSGFSGKACETMICPGAIDTALKPNQNTNFCSGHGRCMTMAELALWSQDNGDPLHISYGSDANLPSTWDSDRIHGCLCDPGYSGYDCSLRECPMGDDPGTYDDHSEVQLLQCVAEAGNFTLSFRQYTTGVLSYNITADQLEQVLSNLPSIGSVSVYFIRDGPMPMGVLSHKKLDTVQETPEWGSFNNSKHLTQGVIWEENDCGQVNCQNHFLPRIVWSAPKNRTTHFCQADGHQIAVVHFTHTHGDVPAIRPNVTFLLDYSNGNGGFSSGKINVFDNGKSILGLTSIRGTTENLPCNHRGLCDTKTGQCNCFGDWTSSDGARQGGAGATGDCGYRNDKKFSFFESHTELMN